MKMRTRLLIAFLSFSILPIIFAGMLISMNRLFLLYQFDDFDPEVKSMVVQMLVSGIFMLLFISAADGMAEQANAFFGGGKQRATENRTAGKKTALDGTEGRRDRTDRNGAGVFLG